MAIGAGFGGQCACRPAYWSYRGRVNRGRTPTRDTQADPRYPAAMPKRPSRPLDNLIRSANQISNRQPDSLQLLAHMIRVALNDGADPYLLTGILAEGAAYAISEHIPSERQPDAVSALMDVLKERLRAHGLA